MGVNNNSKLLLTEFNRVIQAKSISSFSIQKNRMETYSVILETTSGEFVTVAVTSLSIARRLIHKLNKWINSSSDNPFHAHYEIEKTCKIHSLKCKRGV